MKWKNEDMELIKALILLTGRDLNFIYTFIEDNNKMEIIEELLKNLKISELLNFEIVNRILLTIGIPPMSREFFERVFGNINFNNIHEVNTRVNKIRCVYLLEYGNFYYGYKKLREIDPLPVISKYFSTDNERKQLLEQYQKVKKVPAFQPIEVGQRYCLGYLASKEHEEINGYREILIKVLEEAIKKGIDTPQALKTLAQNMGYKNWEQIVVRSAIKYGPELLWWDTLFSKSNIPRDFTFVTVMMKVKEECKRVNFDYIKEIRKSGRKNTYAYLSTSDIDIYFATSMRRALDFVSNAKFLEKIKNMLEETNINLNYFDPTQCYLDDRIQKGLIESIMIKRAKVVVYNAQERETFGKDAEAGIALAHQKPVIIYVPRILPFHEKLKEFYHILDTVGYEKEPLGKELKNKEYLSEEEFYKFIAPETEKTEAIETILTNSIKLQEIFDTISIEELQEELVSQGYDPTNEEIISDIKDFSFKKMLQFESRALLFKDLHPLTFQVSPLDGIPRGVFVTRTPEQTAEIIKGILLKTLEYEIIGDDEKSPNYLLVCKITKSPIRVLPKDISLRIALKRVYEEEKE